MDKVAYYREMIYKEAKEKSKFKKHQENKVNLTPEERKVVLEKKAVWGDGRIAIWKSVDKNTGEVTYHTHTHRAWNTAPTLKGAISRFHNFIKDTA